MVFVFLALFKVSLNVLIPIGINVFLSFYLFIDLKVN